MRIQRPATLLLSAAATTCLLGTGPSVPEAAASCVGPTLAVGASADPGQPTGAVADVRRGQTITVAGIFFHAGCEDSLGSTGLGCRASQPLDPETPLTDVELTLVRGNHVWKLGTADAAGRDQRYAISWTVKIPTDVTVGAATLDAQTASVPVRIR